MSQCPVEGRAAKANILRRLFFPRRFRRDESGAAAVEFGIVAVPFLALTLATIETGIMLMAGLALENAAAQASRLIMTGQTQGFDKEQFKSALCSRLTALLDCEGGVKIDVRCHGPQFSGLDLSLPLDNEKKLKTDFGYCDSKPGAIVVVRAVYEWKVHLSLLGFSLSNMAGNKRLLMGTAVFRNEPFPDG